MPPQPSSASSFSSRTRIVTFGAPRPLVSSLPAWATASANAGGVRSPGGVLTQSRVVATARATTWASSNAATNSFLRASPLSTTTSPATVGSFLFCFLYVVNV